VQRLAKKEPLKGSCADQHGAIAWESKAAKDEPNAENWNYAKVVENKDAQRRCKVTWKAGTQSHPVILKPLQSLPIWTASLPSVPKEGGVASAS
jgi:hypothetical protein